MARALLSLLLALGSPLLAPASPVLSKRASVASYVSAETPVALSGVLANIGPDGALSSGAKSGIVIASPSATSPDYLYTWTRDSALTFKQLVEAFINGNTSLEGQIKNYVGAQAIVQTISNPSGTETTGGLGEPKFNIDETAFTGAWGRPQRDGPALRAITLIMYANAVYATEASYVTGTVWPIIQNDLNYVVTYWNQTGYDLWEEVNGSSFFTIANQYRSMIQGFALAKTITGSGNSSYTDAADGLLCFLQDFWSSSGGYVVANINENNGRTGKDSNSVLGSIHLFDAEAGCDATTFQPCSDKALANHKVVVDSFRSIYAINSGAAADAGVAVGRYPEDSYYNGNPWYLCTLAAAEQLYDALYVWNSSKTVEVTSTSLAFFQQFYASATAQNYTTASTGGSAIVSGVQAMADDFVAIVQEYTPSNGSLSEQYSKTDGTPLSAYDLTWSFSSFLTMAQARNDVTPPSWGASGASTTCSGGGSGSGGGGGGSGDTVSVLFKETVTTTVGENVFITGSVSELSNWDTSSAIALSAANYTSSDNLWFVTVELPPSTTIEYKFLRKESDGSIVWESDPNRSITTPASGSTTESDTWR